MGNGKRKAGGSFYERKKAGWEKRDATKRKDKDTEDKILPSRAHKHVIREYKDESPGRTRTSHPGEQGQVTREDKSESPGRTKSDVKTDGIKRTDVYLSSVSGKQTDKHVFCIKHHLFELYEVIHTDVCLSEVNGAWHGGNIYLGKGISLPCYLKIQ